MGEALETGSIVRIPKLGAAALRAAGLPADQPVFDVVAVPVASTPGVIIALRDQAPRRYSMGERAILEEIADETDSLLSGIESPPEPARTAERSPGPVESPSEPAGASKLAQLANSSGAAMMVLDPEGVTIWANRRVGEMLGVPSEDLVGSFVPHFVHRVEVDEGAPLDEELSERKLMRADGTPIWVAARARSLRNAGNDHPLTLVTLWDTTRNKEREVELRMRLDSERALRTLAERCLKEVDPGEVLDHAVRLLADQLDASYSSVMVVDPELERASIVAAAGRAGGSAVGELEQQSPLRIPKRSIASAAMQEPGPVAVNDFEQESGFERSEFSIRARLRSAVCVPLGAHGSVLAAASSRPYGLGDGAVDLMTSVARLVESHRDLVSELAAHQLPRERPGLRGGGAGRDGVAHRPARFPRRPRH